MKEDGFFYIGHASALVRIGGQPILFDPVWDHKPYGDYWYFSPPQINCDKVTGNHSVAAFVSHIHEDHICERILDKVPLTHVMDGRPPLNKRLAEKTSTSYVNYPPFKWHTNENWKYEFYFVPHAFNTVDSSVFVRNKETGYCVYHGNDNFLSEEMLCKVRHDIGPVDVAMVPYAFIHWYPHCMSNMPEAEKQKEVQRLNQQSMDQAYMFCEIFKPRHVIPFGNNLLHVDAELNIDLAKPTDFVGATQLSAGGFIIGGKVFYEPPVEEDPLHTIVHKCIQAQTTVKNHQLVVNGFVIDLETRTARVGAPTKPYTSFYFKPIEFRKWIAGEITFEQAIGTRQFSCIREPNVYNLEVFEWMNRWL
jgi:L-ascorbate metabolism protein UlaG (beta-lactamase superfamily)